MVGEVEEPEIVRGLLTVTLVTGVPLEIEVI